MEMAEFILGVIVTLLLILVINSCSGSSNATESFTDARGVTITDTQLMTILANGYWYMKDLFRATEGMFMNGDPLQLKIDSGRASLIALARKFNVNAPGSLYNQALTYGGIIDELSMNTTPEAMKALLTYRKNIVYPKNNVYIPLSTLGLYTVVFDALFNKYITTSGLNLNDVSIRDINISGMPY